VPSHSAAFAILAGDLAGLLGEVQRAEGIANRRYALTVLEHGLRLADPGTVDEALRERARTLGVSEDVLSLTKRTAPLHAVRIPLVDASSAQALVRTFFASFDAAPDDRSVRANETDDALREAFDLARKLAGDPRVRPIRWVAAQPRALAKITMEGESLAAGAFLSAYALLSGRAVRPGLAITGTLEGRAMGPVGHLALKQSAAELAGVTLLLVPPGERVPAGATLTVTEVASIDALLAAGLRPDPIAIDLHGVVEAARAQVRRGWRGFRWPEAIELLERAAHVVPDGDLDTKVELLARLGAAERHAGSLHRSDALLNEALRLARGVIGRREVTDATRALAERNHAMTALQRGRLPQAERDAARAVKTAQRGRSRREELKGLSVVGLVARGQGDDRASVAAFEAALAIDLALDPDRVVRSRAYLAEALARSNRMAKARTIYELALSEAQRTGSLPDEAWVRTSYGNGLLARGRSKEALDVLDHPAVRDAIVRSPLPGLRARRLLGTALLSVPSERARGIQLLVGALPSLTMEPGIRRHAALCLLVAHRAGHGGPALLEQALVVLGEDPGALDARTPRARDRALAKLIETFDCLG